MRERKESLSNEEKKRDAGKINEEQRKREK